jgi:hypothetical protein
MEQTQTATSIEQFNFEYNDIVTQKIPQPDGEYLFKLVSKTLRTIPIVADHEKKTVTVNKTTYTTSINHEYSYRINMKSRNIEVNCFDRFILFLKQTGQTGNLWNNCMRANLEKMQVEFR